MYNEQQVQHECADCGVLSPPIREGDTFLSTRHGWRLHRFQNDKREVIFQWRCPICWAHYKNTLRNSVEPPPSSSPRSRVDAPPTNRQGVGVASPVGEQAKIRRGR
ncbi:MAG: hypothetical protein RMJ98_13690 [Myxococcales bacterium]|nr:hypothetical protein [Polyangiaceae bacterium]MDW8250343.1 hypothetical protein [Myxococcales bacterium]